MFEKIKEIIVKVKEDNTVAETLTPASDLINEVGLDSLQMISFILQVEEAFLVEIDYEDFDMAQMKSVETFMVFLSKLDANVG
ncbi:acyl carrier protein [Paenibacillus oryzisoli]|uniref:Carrier domain-containing protein n=1 Tax=Paenibacillus oryzisoli TaxID=1850517 RepID=A0A198ALE3_9BACL|nr:phosphopantetheine-binding protein [Paenibacillus oryzisoli]OAS21841.1 hypothetical protein A8708_06805 [Paenibacillus oryzisoli]